MFPDFWFCELFPGIREFLGCVPGERIHVRPEHKILSILDWSDPRGKMGIVNSLVEYTYVIPHINKNLKLPYKNAENGSVDIEGRKRHTCT